MAKDTLMGKQLEIQVVDALKGVFQEFSAIKVKDIRLQSPRPHRKKDILVQIDVYGHSHVLVCRVKTKSDPCHVRQALTELQDDVNRFNEGMTPIFVAPSLTAEAQSLCRESKAGFLDLEGNAFLVLDEAFFAKRSIPCRHSPCPDGEALSPDHESGRHPQVA
jgi:hypothetical protein